MIKSKLQKEKQELLRLKRIMENNYPKIDITNVYVFKEYDINHIVKADIKRILKNFYELEMTDILSGEVVFRKCSKDPNRLIKRKVQVYDDKLCHKSHFAYIYPIQAKERDLLAFTDNEVPLYVLQKLYYKLNKVNIQNPILAIPKSKDSKKKVRTPQTSSKSTSK